jgi:cell division protein FtsI (penicillin-binding protein 3)
VFANPFLVADPHTAATQLAPILGAPSADLDSLLSDRHKGFVYLKRKLDPGKADQIKSLHIRGVGTMPEPRRRYPHGPAASQLMGMVGTDGGGLFGLERFHDADLTGHPGKREIVRDALGTPVKVDDTKPAVKGRDLHLTIDDAIQERSETVLADVAGRFQAKGATAIVMDPSTGELMALANWPTADANRLAYAPPAARQDRAAETDFEPGSTFKAFTVAGALEDKLIQPDTAFNLPPTINVGGRTIKEAHDRGPEVMSTSKILAESSNVGAVTIGQKLGPQRLDGWIRQFGFGKPTGLDVPGEEPGIVPAPPQYSPSSMGNIPIGQGVAATPLQMATGYEAIANHGVIHNPHVVAQPPSAGRQVISPNTASEVAHMLEGVLGPEGTAPEASVPGYQVAGKTGTAQKPDSQGGYSQSKYVASFVGFAPVNNPRLLVAVVLDEPQGQVYGGSVAAPAFQQIASFALPYLRIPPN